MCLQPLFSISLKIMNFGSNPCKIGGITRRIPLQFWRLHARLLLSLLLSFNCISHLSNSGCTASLKFLYPPHQGTGQWKSSEWKIVSSRVFFCVFCTLYYLKQYICFLELFLLYAVSVGPAPKRFFHSYAFREVIYVMIMKHTMSCYSQEEKN